MKKLLCTLLSAVLAVCTFACIAPLGLFAVNAEAGSAASVIRTEFASDFKQSYDIANDGVIGIPVQMNAYIRSSATANGIGILYVVGSGAVRAGTESDVSIIDDLLGEGYIVTVLDYMDNPAAAYGVDLDNSVHNFLMDFCAGKYTGGGKIVKTRAYMLPAGCRIDLGAYYYSLDTMAPYGCNEYIVETYNMYYGGVKTDSKGKLLPKATTVYDCLKKDLTPINMDLTMDIIYPSNPDMTVPCFAMASSSETYYDSLAHPWRPYMTAALLGGYAGFIYEHEYIPMSRDDHFGYNDSRFTLSYYAALHTHSAAMRRIRYLADKYGYDAEYLSVFGFSKSGYGPALLMDDNRWEKGEFYTLDDYAPEGKDPRDCPAEQPWLTYEGTNIPIDEKPTVVYVGAGWAVNQARNFCIRDGVGPLMGSIGQLDETAGIRYQISSAIQKFDDTDGEMYFLDVPGTQHNPPFVYDEEREADLFYVAWTFLDNHVRAAYREEAPKVLWMTPKENRVFDNANVNVQVNFSRKMDTASLQEGIKVIRLVDNKPIAGEWIPTHGGLTYNYSSAQLLPGSSYRIIVSDECKAADGVNMNSPFIKTFSITGDELVSAYKDACLKNDGTAVSGTSLGVSREDGGKQSLIAFKRDGGFDGVTKALLYLNRTSEESAQVTVEGMKQGKWSVTPSDATLISGAELNGKMAGVDVTDFVTSANSDEVAFRLSTTSNQEVTVDYDFDTNPASFKEYSQYKRGGGSVAVNIVSGKGIDGSKCVSLTKRDYNTRIKFYGCYGKRSFTKADIGSTYKASVWLMCETATSPHIGLMAEDGMTFFAQQNYSIPANQWTKLEYNITVTPEIVENNATAITIGIMNKLDFYIDDLKIEKQGGSAEFASIEDAADDETVLAPTLVLYKPSTGTAVLDGVAVIGSGVLADTVLGGEDLAVSGAVSDDASGCQKAMVKMPISSLASGSTSTLTLKLDTDAPQSISVYGIKDNDAAFADNFTSSVTWNSAYGNDAAGLDADTSAVYGGKAITTLSVSKSGTYTADVTAYVNYMKSKGYSNAAFLLVAEKTSKDTEITFENMSDFTGYTSSWALTASHARGIIADPEDASNSVFYFDKDPVSANDGGYYQNIALTGLLTTADSWTSADIGDRYIVSFRQYNETPNANETTSCYSMIGIPGSTKYTEMSVGNKNITSENPSIAANKANHWINVNIVLDITADVVNSHATSTSIVVASGYVASRIYLDDVKVTKVAGTVKVNGTPTLTSGTNTADASLVAGLNGGKPDGTVSGTDAQICRGSLTGGGNGLKKIYFTFDQSAFPHIESGTATVTIPAVSSGKLCLYGLNNTVDCETLTWNNAYGNNDSNDIDSAAVFGGAPLAAITLGNALSYTVDISEFAVAMRDNRYVGFALCAPAGQKETPVSGLSINYVYSGTPAIDPSAAVEAPANGGTCNNLTVLSASLMKSAGAELTDVAFYIDGEKTGLPLLQCGEAYLLETDTLAEGEHTFKAVFTADGEEVSTDTVTFNVTKEEKILYGDVNGDGKIDNSDLIRLKKYLAGQNVVTDEAAADVTGDGKVDNSDLIRLKKYLAGQSVKLGK